MPAKPIKLLYLITLSEWGGAQKYVFDLVNSFAKNKKYSVTVALGGNESGPLITKLKNINVKIEYSPNLQRSVHLFYDLKALKNLIKLFKIISPDIVHLNSSKAGTLGALAARYVKIKKIIYTVHGLVLNEPLNIHTKILYWLAEWFSAKFKHHLICVSEFDKQSLLKYRISPANKITVVHNGIDFKLVKFLSKQTARQKLYKLIHLKLDIIDKSITSLKTTIIGTIANFYPTKGLPFLIKAIKEIHTQYPNIQFIFIGDGPYRREITQLIIKYNLEKTIFLLGTLDKASQYLKAFDIFVLPSVKEGLSYTLIEAQAAALPIITTTVGGNLEIIKNNINGLVVPPRNSAALSESIKKLLLDKELKDKFIKNNLDHSYNFSLEKMIQKTEKIYN